MDTLAAHGCGDVIGRVGQPVQGAGDLLGGLLEGLHDLLDGNEASAFLLASAYTAADVLTKIKTVDGVSSGLDADLLDGNHASAFATSAQGTKADNALPAADAVSANTANKAVKRDGSGDFVAGTITVTDIIIS
jgi:hypothetical protein